MGYLQAKCFKKWSHRLDAEGNDDDEAISWTKTVPDSFTGAGADSDRRYLLTVQVSEKQIFLHMR